MLARVQRSQIKFEVSVTDEYTMCGSTRWVALIISEYFPRRNPNHNTSLLHNFWSCRQQVCSSWMFIKQGKLTENEKNVLGMLKIKTGRNTYSWYVSTVNMWPRSCEGLMVFFGFLLSCYVVIVHMEIMTLVLWSLRARQQALIQYPWCSAVCHIWSDGPHVC